MLLLHGLCAIVLGQGDMHPDIGMPPGCRLNVTNECAPTYADLANKSKLWACPTGTKSAHSTWPRCRQPDSAAGGLNSHGKEAEAPSAWDYSAQW